MAIVAAENFQLKWHSYGAYMHNSVATLLRSESFTDITLATVDGRQIQAHRFVLSACSSYLHQLLRVVYPATNSNNPIVIVLPSEISYRILKVLVEYMYSGEATVSYGQLDGILKAAHILGIRGLCRENNSGDNSTSLPTHRHAHDENERYNKKTSNDHTKATSSDERILQESSKSNSNRSDKSSSHASDRSDDSESNEEVQNTSKEGTRKESAKHGNNADNNHSAKHAAVSVDVVEAGPVQLLVKQEPIEWVDTELEEPLDENEPMQIEMTVKPEILQNVSDDEQTLYSPLTCDICQKTFTTPADWVHHIEAHPEIYQHSGRQHNMRNSEVLENANPTTDFPPLRCELCELIFTTPGDWVRHIQSSHTEQELAISNNSYEPSKMKRGGRKRCQMCSKTFPSYASMMIHRRTHTGEKPYICAICSKGFNVKSNLLRHLRTLHDQIVSPSNVD